MASREVIVRTVLELLESDGYDAVQLREVARRAHVSMTTIYNAYPTRDDLIVAATEYWMSVNGHAPIAGPPPGESMYDGLMRIYRHVFEPWERSPRMLETYHRVSTSETGARLREQGARAVVPAARAVLAKADARYVSDVETILTNMSYAVIGRFTDGEIDVTDILTILERAVYRLTVDNATAADKPSGPHDSPGVRPRRPRPT
jgi:AcrR family transcriptional regulator